MAYPCPSLDPVAVDSLVTRARIALDFPAIAQRMPLVRFDRNGLVFSLGGSIGLPGLGLPKQAAILSREERLCELRMVVRSIERIDDRAPELTVQPSRADDDEAFWQALRARQLAHRQTVVHAFAAPRPACGRANDSGRFARLRDLREPSAMSRGVMAFRQTPMSAVCELHAMPTRCAAAFIFHHRDDALFFADWLEYHFAEIGAYAKSVTPYAERFDLETQLTGREVRVEFHYLRRHAALHACTEAVCRWMEEEVKRRFGLTVATRRLDASQAREIPNRPRRSAAGYSFSSK